MPGIAAVANNAGERNVQVHSPLQLPKPFEDSPFEQMKAVEEQMNPRGFKTVEEDLAPTVAACDPNCPVLLLQTNTGSGKSKVLPALLAERSEPVKCTEIVRAKVGRMLC